MNAVKALSAAIFLGVVTYAQAQPRATLQACVDRASTDSALYPQRIDRGTTITGVSCREKAGRIVYTYDNKLDTHRSRLAPNALSIQAKSVRTMLCTNPEITALLRLVDMEYVYYDSENFHIGSIVNRIEDCEQATTFTSSSPSSASDGNWIAVNQRNVGKAVLEIDRASLVREGNHVRVWTRAIYETAFPVNGSGSITRKVLALNEINCVDRTETVRRVVFIGADEQPISGAEKGPFETTDIVPGTPKEDILRIVCKPPQALK